MGKQKREKEEGEGVGKAEGSEAGLDQPGADLDASQAAPPVPVTKTYEELVELVSVIAKPLAGRKLTKRLYKAVRKAKKAKRLRRGVREVVKALRKNGKGVVVLAGDVSPIDVISHIPVFCEEKEVPYCYVPSRKDLGLAGGTQRPTSVVLVQSGKDYEEVYQECHSLVSSLPMPLSC
jgi:H/ACA ribonucleoprotein complex subunit 2